MILRSLSPGRIASTVTILSLAAQHSFSSRLHFLGLEFSFINTQWLNKVFQCRQFSVSAPTSRGRRWTDEEFSTLRELTHEGIPLADIAKKLDKTVAAIYSRRRVHGMRFQRPSRRPNKSWTQEEEVQARALIEKGLSLTATAETLGRSYSALQGHLRHLAMKRSNPSYPQAAAVKRISSETLDKVIKMRSCGLSWSEIQAAIPEHPRKSLMAVWQKHLEHGRLQDQPYAARWTHEESELLLHLRGERKLVWSSIQRYIPGRSRAALEARYKRTHRVPRSSNPPKYTLNELELLAKLKAESRSWPEIAAHIPERSPGSLVMTYHNRVADGYSIASDGSVQWTKEWKARNPRMFLEDENERDSDVSKPNEGT